MGNFGNKLTTALGNVAHEVTGKQMFDPTSAHSVVVEALERNRSAEALARRIWLSFVIEGNDALFLEDIIEVLGDGRQVEAEEAFAALDQDANGDVSLDEMILTVTEYGRERHSIANSMHDVDQAITVLDRLLMAVVFIAIVFIFVAFLNRSFGKRYTKRRFAKSMPLTSSPQSPHSPQPEQPSSPSHSSSPQQLKKSSALASSFSSNIPSTSVIVSTSPKKP